MEDSGLIPHLFRTEFSRIAAVLCKHFGIAHIAAAEDIAGDTFLAAMETWTYKGIPANPTAWLYAVAKNKAKNYITRNLLFDKKIAPSLVQHADHSDAEEIDLTEKNITDSQLQMLFAICYPALSTESQVCLALRILCGFGIGEIADAFLSNKETIKKRLTRAREKLRTEKVKIAFPSAATLNQRLPAVLTTIYLLFNEGYYSESRDEIVRKDLCLEAIRLAHLLTENETTNLPPVNALMALICFHASRLDARKDENGRMLLYHEQDESRWNQQLVAKAVYYLHIASKGNQLTKYHIEAAIAYRHTIKPDTPEKWETVLQLFDRLLELEYSSVAALNRIYALSKVKGNAAAIKEAESLKLNSNQYYFALLGELNFGIDTGTARLNYEKALVLAKTETDKDFIRQKLEQLN